jgi:hypothetical protein
VVLPIRIDSEVRVVKNKILTVLVVLGLGLDTQAQISAMSASGKKGNAVGVAVNMAVGVGLATTSHAMCGNMYQQEQAQGPVQPGATAPTGTSFNYANLVLPNITGDGPSCTGGGPWTAALRVTSIAVSFFSAMSYAQGASDMISMMKSNESEKSSSYGGDGGYGAMSFADAVMPDGSTMSGDNAAAGLNNLSNLLKKNGMGIDLKTGKVTLPNGKSIDSSIMGQGAGAIAAATGLPESAINKALEEMRKTTKNQLNMLNSDKYRLSFSGGGRGGLENAGDKKEGPGLDFSKLFGNRKPTAVPKVSGLQKNIGGTAVGVAQDDIFQMVQRRYQEKNKSDFFSK